MLAVDESQAAATGRLGYSGTLIKLRVKNQWTWPAFTP